MRGTRFVINRVADQCLRCRSARDLLALRSALAASLAACSSCSLRVASARLLAGLGLGNVGLLAAAGRQVDRRLVAFLDLVGHFLEHGVGQDQVDHLALDDLVPQHVHRAALLQPGPHAPRRFVALLGDQRDFRFVIVLVGVDLLLFGDPLEDEVLLQGPGRRGHAVLPQGVLVGADFLVAETAALQFHHRPLQFAMALPLQQAGGSSQLAATVKRRGDLLAGALPLLVFQLPGELVLDRVAELGFELEAAQLLEQLGRQLGQFQLLDFQHLEDRRDLLAAQGRVGRVVAELASSARASRRRGRRPSPCRSPRSCRRGN